MGQYWLVLVCWYCVSIFWYSLVLSGTGLIQDFLPVYIEKVEIWAGDTNPSLTHMCVTTDNRT